MYRRFFSREELARKLALVAMRGIENAARAALVLVPDDPWAAFVGFVVAAMAAGAGSMSAYAGAFRAGDELNAAGMSLSRAVDELVTHAQAARVLRPDVTALDVLQIFEMLRAVQLGNQERSDRLRIR